LRRPLTLSATVPELPDVTIYIERLHALLTGVTLERIRIASPFVLRSVDPPPSSVEGKPVTGFRRLGKRIVFEFEDELFLIIHLMIAGRLRWRDRGAALPKKNGLVAFDFETGTLLFTEAAGKKRASLHLARGLDALTAHDRGGIDVLSSTVEDFRHALTRENHTLKRALTDPRLLSGIGNAYSDEILHAARLSPLQLTRNLQDEEIARLHEHTLDTLERWIAQTREEVGDAFPEKVTAFQKDMAVHGRYGQPCPVCGSPVQRIVYAANEVNYCAGCQTNGKLLADRAFSRLLKGDWPRTVEEWEEGIEKRREK
jgi:formamidopyrimidine-DNA glycosylase